MRIVIVICAIFAIALSASIPENFNEKQQPIKPVQLRTEHYTTKVDHFRPQDSRTVEFV